MAIISSQGFKVSKIFRTANRDKCTHVILPFFYFMEYIFNRHTIYVHALILGVIYRRMNPIEKEIYCP